MSLNRAELSLAVKISNRLKADFAQWQENCEQDRREGHRPSHCEHGTYLWRDWDVICGACEDGMSMGDPRTRMEYAIDSSKRRWAKCREIAEAVAVLRDLGVSVDPSPAWEEMDRLLTP